MIMNTSSTEASLLSILDGIAWYYIIIIIAFCSNE